MKKFLTLFLFIYPFCVFCTDFFDDQILKQNDNNEFNFQTQEWQQSLEEEILKEEEEEAKHLLLRLINKTTTKNIVLSIDIGSNKKIGSLNIHSKQCLYQIDEDNNILNSALLKIEESSGDEVKTIFDGWIFKEYPAVSGLEHPLYEVSLIKCVK